MSSEITVLIADDNAELGDMLSDVLSRTDCIKVLGVARDGAEAVDMIHRLSPDVVILDIVMPKLDGIGVLEKTAGIELAGRPQFLVLSAIGQDALVQKAVDLGADYYIVKPFDVDVMISRLKQIHAEKEANPFTCKKVNQMPGNAQPPADTKDIAIELEITNILRDLGIPPNIKGYTYIREAVLQKLKNPREFSSVTKVLYPSVAEKYDTTPDKVERAIRNAIDVFWANAKVKMQSSLFGAASTGRKKPTNSELIAMITDRICLRFKDNK